MLLLTLNVFSEGSNGNGVSPVIPLQSRTNESKAVNCSKLANFLIVGLKCTELRMLQERTLKRYNSSPVSLLCSRIVPQVVQAPLRGHSRLPRGADFHPKKILPSRTRKVCWIVYAGFFFFSRERAHTVKPQNNEE